ncbi:MAG: putative metallopeptidase [Bacillota bacterium]
MAVWQEAPDLAELAVRVIAKRPEVAHVDPDEVLFLWELETTPTALARCYRLTGHPIGFFTHKPWAVVFYKQNMDYMSSRQRALVMLHELMHIPERGDRLVDHTVKDFATLLGIDLHWSAPGREVPDILE